MGWSLHQLHNGWRNVPGFRICNKQCASRAAYCNWLLKMDRGNWLSPKDSLQSQRPRNKTRGNDTSITSIFHTKPTNMPRVQTSTSRTKKWSTHVEKYHPSRPLWRNPVSPAKAVWTNRSAALPYPALVSPTHPPWTNLSSTHPIQPMIWVWDRTPKPGYPIDHQVGAEIPIISKDKHE